MRTEITLHTQDRRPLLGETSHPTPLGAKVLQSVADCCDRLGQPLLEADLASDRLVFQLEGAPSLPQLRRLLLLLRQTTTPFHETGDNAGYCAVLWQRQPVIQTLP